MPIPQIPPLNQDADINEIKNYVIRLERTLNFLLENGLDSENVFEVGGWRVKDDTLSSKDGDVGMTTEGSSGGSIRLWAGSTDPNTAPWRVSRDGTAYMTGAEIYNELSGGAYTSIGSNGITINDGTKNTFRANTAGQVTMTGATIINNLISGAYTNISDNGITINDGTMDTFRADVMGQVTMMGALIRSKNGFPAVVMNPATNLFGAYASATSYVTINSVGSGAGSPQVTIQSPIGYMYLYQSGTASNIVSGGNMGLSAAGDLELNLSGISLVPFSQLEDFGTGITLQAALNSKADAGISTGLSGSHNHGIPNGTVLMVDGGGTVTWSSAGSHSHAQN
jgi:hypothetical protein